VNLEMVKAGLAEVYRGAPALALDLRLYWKAEEDAKKARRGMWVLGNRYMSPKDWRHSKQKDFPHFECALALTSFQQSACRRSISFPTAWPPNKR
jgi:hypothetical protein